MAKTYLYQPDKKLLKQGAILTDESGSTVYEAIMVKNSLFGGMQFDFVNHVTNRTVKHKVGHTLTTETGVGGGFELLSTKSRFKLDGKNIWDFLHEQGVRIDSNLSHGRIGMTYTVTLKGHPLAALTTAAPGGKGLITSSHYYEVTAEENDLDLAFLVTFAIARTDQVLYS